MSPVVEHLTVLKIVLALASITEDKISIDFVAKHIQEAIDKGLEEEVNETV